LVSVAALAGAVAVLAGLIGFQRWQNIGDGAQVSTSDAAEAAPTTTTTTTTTTGSSTESAPDAGAGPGSTLASPPDPQPDSEPGPQPDLEAESEQATVETLACPTQYEAVICEAAEFVQQVRQRPFKRFPTVELLDDREFDQALVEDLDQSRPDLERSERLLKSLGLIPLDLNLYDTFEALLESGVVGFYDPESERLVVRGGELDLYGQLILVHELVHAFDDQWFDLDRDEFTDDAEYGFLAVVEGNASRVEQRWRERLTPEQAVELNQQELTALSPSDLSFLLSLPEVILTLQLSPYQDGQIYVERLHQLGGEPAIDEKLLTPPASSEEVLHADTPPDALTVVPVDVPPAVGLLIDDGTIGELLLESWLGPTAAAGWGGDRYVTWDAGTQTCFTVDLAADTATDLEEMDQAARRWAADLPDGRTVETVESGTLTLVRVSGCY
jgi:hypothetical protein